MPYLLGLVVLLIAAAGAGYVFREKLGIDWFDPKPPPAPLEAEVRVRSEPPGLVITADGQPIEGGLLSVPVAGPFPLLRAESGCRVIEQQLSGADLGGEVVLLPDPAELVWNFAPSVAGAKVSLNGTSLGAAPVDMTLDLCADNAIEVSAPGFEATTLTLPAGVMPLDARTQLQALDLAEIPKGTLELSRPSTTVTLYLDGKRLKSSENTLELTAGRYKVRAVNGDYFIDSSQTVEVKAGEMTRFSPKVPALTELVVQAFPPDCKLFVRRPGGQWKYVDDTPARRKLAVGSYEVKVELKATGETRETEVTLKSGQNPPVRIAFARS